jgi:CBS-domain-containing membrane protein
MPTSGWWGGAGTQAAVRRAGHANRRNHGASGCFGEGRRKLRHCSRSHTEQRLLALPVVDEENRLIGIVDISALTHAIWYLERREKADEAFQMAGMRLDRAYSSEPQCAAGSFLVWTSLAAGVLLRLL